MAYIEHDFPIEQLTPLARREANAKRPIYQLHKWFARRLGCIFRTIVLASFIPEEEWRALDEKVRKQKINAWYVLYYEATPEARALIDRYVRGKIVLDPFMGGGTTVVEALRLGCRVIGIDLNPVAWFIVKKSIEPVPLEDLDAAFAGLKRTVAPEITKFYKTLCPRCDMWSAKSPDFACDDGSHRTPESATADVMYVFWVKTVTCDSCGRDVRLFNSYRLATKSGVHTIFCPSCFAIDKTERLDEEFFCRSCGRHFVPDQGVSSGGKFTCENCGHSDKLVDWIARHDATVCYAPTTCHSPFTTHQICYEMFAIEYWCPKCKTRDYKPADNFDRELYTDACRAFEEERDGLQIPNVPVQDGLKTRELLNHGMRRFSDLFNPRQLWGLGKLMRGIQEMENQELRELLLVNLSDCIRSNNLLCDYENIGRYRELAPLFVFHAYRIPSLAIENNIWGTKYGRGTLVRNFAKTRRAVKWALSPKEPNPTNGTKNETSTSSPVKGRWVSSCAEVITGNGDVWLAARNSADLSMLASNSVDAVITDPPYYDNVQYSELSDFFYVWLQEALRDTYPGVFSEPMCPRDSEVVVNKRRKDKDDEHFREGLLSVFHESNRVLKEGGMLAFTFHHEDAKAWAAVVDCILKADFNIVTVWPCHSEVRQGAHGGGIRFDTIVVCRKRQGEPMEAAWGTLQDEIAAAAQAELRRLLSDGAALTNEDIFVITMGKALGLYSRHWPKVMRGGQPVPLTHAIEDIEKLVDEQIDIYFGLVVPAWLDVVPRTYLQYLARRDIVTRDNLVKVCRPRNLEWETFVEQGYLKRGRKAGEFKVLSPADREADLRRSLERGEALNPIDRAHLLYAALKANRPLRQEVPRVYADRLEEVCTALYRITRDRIYETLAEQIPRYKKIIVMK